MQGTQLRKLEAELWRAADQLRANSKLTASEYSMPVLGLIFLRHAFNRFEKVRIEIEKDLPVHPQRGKRTISKNDFLEKNALFLPEISRFEYLVNFPEGGKKFKNEKGEDEPVYIGGAIDMAMKAIEDEYENLKGILPRNYSIFSKDLLHDLIRIFNKEVLQKTEGDLFGKIYEYFLNKFAMTGAQEGGEFFTPFSLVNTIVNVIEPDHGIVFDPACGSAGMFVQTGYFIENEGLQPAEKVTFYGQEKAETNTRLAKMNLAVHGLEGDIQEGNTFYEDKHELVGKCDFVMANPPFNVDGVDKSKNIVKTDPRLPFGLPKNDNANYLWIQYFYSYLKPTARAGFVMASSASDAGHSEKDIREKLVKTGAVDVMMAIGNNFFYTRSLPCTLWFFDRSKENDLEKSKRVLMLDARKIYHKVTQKINDFSPEQLQNIICIVSLYRGNSEKFKSTIKNYIETAEYLSLEVAVVVENLQTKFKALYNRVGDFASKFSKENSEAHSFIEQLNIEELPEIFKLQTDLIDKTSFKQAHGEIFNEKILENISRLCKELRKPQDKLIKQLFDAITNGVKSFHLNKISSWKDLNIKEQLDQIKQLHQKLSGNTDEEEPGLLNEIEYFYKHLHWLSSRFPDEKYVDVEGLCKVVTLEEIASKDFSLSPGRYVGVDVAIDDGIDYEERLKEIHIELEGLNEEAIKLTELIQLNYKQIV